MAGIAVDIYLKKQEQRQSRHQAVTDSLTGALSRHSFEKVLTAWQENCPPERCRCSLLLLDLDQFQRVNQEHGHNMGDKLLKQFVQICLKVLGEDDKLARIEGDKFAVLLPGAGAEKAKAVAQSLRERLEQTPMALGLDFLSLTATMGIAVHSAGSVKPANLILRADSALHIAKERNCHVLLESELV